MKRIILYTATILLLQSCYSYRTNFKGPELKGQFKALPKQEAFVINEELYKKEYRILKRSQIYVLTNDSSCATKIELSKGFKQPYFGCAMYLVGFAFFIGQMPVVLPEKYFFEYKEIQAHDTTVINLQLNYTKRLWFWDMFSTKKNLENTLAKEIRYNKVKSQKQEVVTSIQPNQKTTHGQ